MTLKSDLYIDEAYYYNWAKHLDLGYYSKPPMLSLLIALTTKIFGESVFAIKVGAVLVYPLTAYVVYLIARELFDEKTAFYSGLTFFTLPSVWLSSLIISTDVVLLLFWALALLFFIKALKSDRWFDWSLAGVFSGLGLLSKYNFIFFLVSIFLVFLTIPKYKKEFKNPKLYLAILLAFVIFLPNLWWNYQNDFISFVHTKQISHIDKKLLHPNHLFDFLGAQFVVFGPILFFYFWVIAFKREFLTDERFKILFYFAIVMLGFIMVLSFLSRSFANWAAPSYVSATILVVAYLIKQNRVKLVIFSIVLHSLLGVGLYHYHDIAKILGIKLSRHTDPYKRVLGWKDVIDQVKVVRDRYPNHYILSKSRGSVAELDFYLKEKTYIFNPNHEMENQYHMDRDLNKLRGKNFIFVGGDKDEMRLKKYFKSVKRIGKVVAPLYVDFNRSYTLFEADGFKGY
jgi:4-amino-4-deoxy-L-arabinose transferase-like glycosyltransferase